MKYDFECNNIRIKCSLADSEAAFDFAGRLESTEEERTTEILHPVLNDEVGHIL